ncbi:hypothetical protein ACIP28_17825 [Streptomyces albidoflavus]
MPVPNSVRWADLDPAKIENMISVLISRLHTDVQRIDGSGGDGGRDVQIPLSSGLVIYEVKSFTGRLNGSRREQIKRSLKKAASHNPKEWRLVMPLDLTPGELEWYNSLKGEYPFIGEFTRGLTWLDSEMARRSDIVRYYVGDSNSEIVGYLREMNREEAALANGVTDAVSRVERIIAQLNNIDPHYVFGVHLGPAGVVKTTVHPRYPGAELDRPIVIKANFTFPKTPEGEAAAASFRDSMDYGVPMVLSDSFIQSVEVDAPAGMGGTFPGGVLAIGSVQQSLESDDVRFAVVAADACGRPLATLPLKLAGRFRGGRGVQLEFSDESEFLSLRVRVAIPEKTGAFTFKFAHKGGVLPSALLPTIRFLLHLKVGNQWGLSRDGVVSDLHALPEAFMPEIAEYGRYLKILAKLQEFTNFQFPVPQEMSDAEIEMLKRVMHLIDGNSFKGSWGSARIILTREGVESWRAITGSDSRQILIQEDFYAEMCGNRIYVGQLRKHVASARVENLPTVEMMSPGCNEFPVSLIPGDDDTITVSLVPREKSEI